jgi:hypothetical protein
LVEHPIAPACSLQIANGKHGGWFVILPLVFDKPVAAFFVSSYKIFDRHSARNNSQMISEAWYNAEFCWL